MQYLTPEDFPDRLNQSIKEILQQKKKVSFSFMIQLLKEEGWKNVSRIHAVDFEHNGYKVEYVYKDNDMGVKNILSKTYIVL